MPTIVSSSTDWDQRQGYWRRRLSRLRLDAEPIEVQVERYRRVTWGLTVLPGLIAVGFVSLFTAFGRPGIGAVVAGVLLSPIVVIAWFDFARLSRGASAYLRERDEHERRFGGQPSVSGPLSR